MLTKEELVAGLAVLLKEKGCRKNRQTWSRKKEGLTLVLNIQNSQWDKETYYINLGVHLDALDPDRKTVCFSNCQIVQSIPACDADGKQYPPEKVSAIFDLWDEWYGTLEKLRNRATNNQMPTVTSAEAWTYLTTYRWQ